MATQNMGTAWRWNENPQPPFVYMDLSNMMEALDPQTTSAGFARTIIAPHTMPTNSFGTSFNMMNGHHQIPQNSYIYTNYTDGSSTALAPNYGVNFAQQRPLPRMIQTFSIPLRETAFDGSSQQGFIERASQSQSPSIKPEPQWVAATSFKSTSSKNLATPAHTRNVNALPLVGSSDTDVGSTSVDRLMKIIQDKAHEFSPQSQLPSIPQSTSVVGAPQTLLSRHDSMNQRFHAYDEEDKQMLTYGKTQEVSRRAKISTKKFICTFENCQASFSQKAQLETHDRKHTGVRPFVCTHESCGRRFTQQGNLNTHLDRHSGERRFACEICSKRFGQRSNLSAHRNVHTGARPFPCKLDGCDKRFTTRGNLKSHHNNFHGPTIENLIAKFERGEIDIKENLDFWTWFLNLNRNLNKGIKGRGKDRKISPKSRTSRGTGSNASRYTSNTDGMRSCHGLMSTDCGSSLGIDVTMYDSDASLRSHGSGSMSVHSSFSSCSTNDGTASTCSSFTEEITGGDYKNHGNGNASMRNGLTFGDRLY